MKIRLAAIDEDIWPQHSTIPLVPTDSSIRRTEFSEFIKSGRVVFTDVLKGIYSGFRTTEVRQILMGQDFGNLMATSHL